MNRRNEAFTRSRKAIATALAGLLALGLLSAGSTAIAQRVEVGIAAAIAGDVRISNSAAPKERRIARKERLGWGDVIRTAKKSQLQILLLDESSFTIGARTRMVIDRFVYDPGKKRSFLARVLEGAFRFMSGRKTPESSARIDSPVGTIGIRGTMVDGLVGKQAFEIARKEAAIPKDTSHDRKRATLVVLRGPGAANQSALTPGLADVSAAGKTVTLSQSGLAAYIPHEGAPPIGPFRISEAGLSRLQDQMQPAVTRANKGSGLGKILAGAAVAVGAAILLTDDDKTPRAPGTADTQCNPGPNQCN